MDLQHQMPSREESHQPRDLNKGQVQKDHSRADPRNRDMVHLGRDQSQVKDPLDRDQNQVKDHLGRDPGKVRDQQVRDPNQARVLLAKAPQGNRHPDQGKHHQVKVPNRVALPSKRVDPHHKDLESLDLNSRDLRALGLNLVNLLRVEGLLLSKVLESLEVRFVHCAKPPR